MTILELNEDHDVSIIEMGANQQGDIEYLCSITKPTHGLITNISYAHIKNFKNLRGVAQAKAEIINNIVENLSLIHI